MTSHQAHVSTVTAIKVLKKVSQRIAFVGWKVGEIVD
jgi:hypothetical protein